MKQLITFDPLFNPTDKTLDFSLLPGFQADMLYGVINITRSQILYAPGTTTYGGTWAGPVLTLTFDTSSYAQTDELNVYYETDPANSNLLYNNNARERGGMLDAHYVLLQQVLIELRVQTFLMAEAFRISQQDIDFARNDALNPANNPDSTGLG